MTESNQYTQDEHDERGENQDLVATRDLKAGILARAVVDREEREHITVMIILGAALFTVIASFSALAYGLHKINVQSAQNTRALCGLREGYEKQLVYFKNHPDGLPPLFSAVEAHRFQADTRAKIEDLGDVKC